MHLNKSIQIIFKGKVSKMGNRYHIYIPRAWYKEVEEIRKRGKKVLVYIIPE